MTRSVPVRADARRALAWGLTWGLAVAVCEALATSPQRWESPRLLLWWLTYWAVPFWCAIGALLVGLLTRAVRNHGIGSAIANYLILGPVVAIVQPLISAFMMILSRRYFPGLYQYALDLGATPTAATRVDLGVYDLWVYLFYGGLLTASYLLTMRTERIRTMLHASAMARSRTEGLVDAQRLEVLQAQIDPALLLQVLRELESRYRIAPERGEQLLEALVEFLRCAMHGLRVPVSTLDTELRLARAFAQLQDERELRGAWRIEDEPDGTGAQSRFPSHMVLPLLSLAGPGDQPVLRTIAAGRETILQVSGLARGVPARLCQQLRARLHALYGSDFRLECSASEPTRLAITLIHGLAN